MNTKGSGSTVNLAAGSKPGPHHIRNGVPNQDAYNYIQESGFTVLALADGAGSLNRSQEGAEIAAKTSVRIVSDLMGEAGEKDLGLILQEAIRGARDAVLSLPHWKDAGSTLAIAVISKEHFAAAVVGDSFAVADTSDGLLLVQPPAIGEFANITKLLTSDDFTVALLKGKRTDLKSITLCSDAFEQSTLAQLAPTEGFWSRIFELAKDEKLDVHELIDYMESQDKIDDDATMVIASLPEEDTAEYSESNIEIELVELKDIA